MKHGFKLYSAKVVRGLRGRAALDVSTLGQDGDLHYADYLADVLLPELHSLGNLTGNPRLTLVGEELPPLSDYMTEGVQDDPRVAFSNPTRHGSHTVLFTVSYGTVGRYETAAGADATKDAAIADMSTNRLYRCCLFLPKTGIKGVMAVENIRGSSPAAMVPRWLKRMSHEIANASIPKRDPYGLGMHGVLDLERLKEMLGQANKTRIHLAKKTLSPTSDRWEKQIVLEETITTEAKRQGVFDYAKMVLGMDVEEAKGHGVVELVDLVDENVGDPGFNEGYVAIESDAGTKKIGPRHLDRIFVYPVSEEHRPTDDVWLKEVKRVIGGMATTLEVNLDLS
ncbi:hypothetical protein [Kribbella swartbergensis]